VIRLNVPIELHSSEDSKKDETRALDLLRVAQRRFSDLIRSLPVGIVIANDDGSIEAVNPAVVELFGYTERELVGKNVTTLFREPPWEKGSNVNEWSLANPLQTIETLGKAKFEELVPMDVSIRRLGTESRERLVVLIQDVTERFLANKLKEEFMQMIHHDICSPLSSLVAFLDTMNHEERYGTLTESGRLRLAMAQQNVNRVLGLVSSLLELDRLESGRALLKLDNITADQLINQALMTVHEQADAKNITLESQIEPAEFQGDLTRLIQVAVNLLTNAINHSVSGRPIKVTATKASNALRIAIQDNGAGVPEAEKTRIFERFDQGSQNKARGYGLGLAICKEIIKQHGGTIACEDAPGGGSIFWFAIPLTAPIDNQYAAV
jgi:PAS domain S-box-containing protein